MAAVPEEHAGIVANTREFEISASVYPEKISEVRWAPSEAIVNLARQIAANKASTLLSHGMGPNHFFNADLKDRALFAAITMLI